MYNFYYEYLKPKYKDKVKLLYMDTDSFVLEIETDDFFKDTKDELKELFILQIITKICFLTNIEKMLV